MGKPGIVTYGMRGLLFLFIIPLGGCQTVGFYTQGIAGQAEILWKAKPNEKLLASPETPEALRKRIILAGELCRFASEELALPGDSAYHRYADLERPHVVYVLHAAKEFSMEPKSWRYPVVGEMDYRGYFKQADALAYAEKLRAEGYEIHLGGTDAYSTLGVFHDPLLNTFINYPEIDFAETIFHELTHRRIFVTGDTTYNESLANVVQEEGMRRYLRAKGRLAELADYEERLVRRREFYNEVEVARAQLTALYASGAAEEEMRAKKRIILAKLKARARALQDRWGTKALEGWLTLDLTNAHLLALVTYNSEMPRFRKLLEENGGDFGRFFEALDKAE